MKDQKIIDNGFSLQCNKGFIILELIIAIIAFLANIAMSTLNNYIIRTRLTEKLILVEKHKNELEIFSGE